LKGIEMITYNWALANGSDVNEIVELAQRHFESEIDNIFTPEPPTMSRNLIFAVTNQFYLPGTVLITVCREAETGRVLAYTWAKSNDRGVWSDDPMVSVLMAHVDMTLSARLRITLLKEMMDQWEQYARYCKNNIICSTTMRHDQDAFLKLHKKNGYDVRGSYAYKKLNAE
jgi:hypothetical protein